MSWPLHLLRRVLGCSARSFPGALHDPAAAQRRVLAEIAADLARTAYGREHGVRTAEELLSRVPPRTWDELSPWLERQRAGEPGVLTARRILFHEPTSGSSGLRKEIPYTAALRSAFSRMFVLWAHDLLSHGPAFRTGRTWISVSPSLQPRPPGSTQTDADYLDGWLRPLARRFLVDPPGVATAADPETFWGRLAEGLVDAGEVEVFSVWSPTFATLLMDHIAARREELAARVAGERRRALLADPVDWRALWPELRLVSCWTEGHAAPAAEELVRRLPGVMVQGKGLLATEAPITVPLVGGPAGVPLVDCVYLELLTEAGELLPLHRGEEGGVYEIVVTQQAGLVRYRLGDRVQVRGRRAGTPCLRFVGRAGGVSDLVGEKLHPDHVERVLAQLVPSPFRMLVPLRRPVDHYALLLTEPAAAELAQQLDRALGEAHHYRHARRLGQLAAPEIIVSPRVPRAWLDEQARQGARLGDVKHRFLVAQPADGWVDPLREGA